MIFGQYCILTKYYFLWVKLLKFHPMTDLKKAQVVTDLSYVNYRFMYVCI